MSQAYARSRPRDKLSTKIQHFLCSQLRIDIKIDLHGHLLTLLSVLNCFVSESFGKHEFQNDVKIYSLCSQYRELFSAKADSADSNFRLASVSVPLGNLTIFFGFPYFLYFLY